MKITHLFRSFLETKHYLVLPSLGKVDKVSVEINPLTGDFEKNIIRFTEDQNLTSDPDFISYASNKLNIDFSLVESDLKCFCNSINELLIQGFEAEIPAVGFLHKYQGKHLMFSGQSIYKSASKEIKRKPSVFLSSSFWL